MSLNLFPEGEKKSREALAHGRKMEGRLGIL